MTQTLLWQENRVNNIAGYSYSQPAEHYQRSRATIDPVILQGYLAVERPFVDYAGATSDTLRHHNSAEARRRPARQAKIETAVQIAERELLAPLRRQRHTALADLSAVLRQRLEALNDRPFQKLPVSRRSLLMTAVQPTLRPPPAMRYGFA